MHPPCFLCISIEQTSIILHIMFSRLSVHSARVFTHSHRSSSLKSLSKRFGIVPFTPKLHRCLSTDTPQENKPANAIPNLIYYGLYSTFCYTGVYIGTLATVYMAVTNGMVCPSSFDIDQVESAAKVWYSHMKYFVIIYVLMFITTLAILLTVAPRVSGTHH